MKYVLTHFQGDYTWAYDYSEDVLIYNRSNEDIPGSIKRENIGDADYDRLSYLVDNYDTLPEVFLLSKSNLFKFITKQEFELVKDNDTFTPLLTQHHKVYEPICRYQDGIYEEINNSWYMGSLESRYFHNYPDFAQAFNLPNPEYLRFAPGGNYILRDSDVRKHPKELYEALRDLLPYSERPGEAHLIERTYYTLWK